MYPPSPVFNRELKHWQWRPRLGKRHLKSMFALLQTFTRFFHLVQFVKFGDFFWSWILTECIKVQEKKKRVVVLRSRPPQNVKLGVAVQRWQGNVQNWKRDARAKLLFCLLNPLLFSRSCYRRRCRCLSSLLLAYDRTITRTNTCSTLARDGGRGGRRKKR